MGWLKKTFKKFTGIMSFGLIKEKQTDRFYERYGRTAFTTAAAAGLIATGVGAAAGLGLAATVGTGATVAAGAGAGTLGGSVAGSKMAGEEGRMYGAMIGGAIGGGVAGYAAAPAGAVSTVPGTSVSVSTSTVLGLGGAAGGYMGSQVAEADYQRRNAASSDSVKPGAPQAAEGVAAEAQAASESAGVVDVAGEYQRRAGGNNRRRLYGSLGSTGGLGSAAILGSGI